MWTSSRSPALLALCLLTAMPSAADAAPSRARASAGKGKSRTVVAATGRKLDVTVGRGKGQRSVTLQVGGKCSTKTVSSVVANTVKRNARAFRGRSGATTFVRGTMKPGELADFEATMAGILNSGRHRVTGKRGFTEIPGFRIDAPGRGRGSKGGERRGRDSGGGSFTVTPTRGGGSTVVRQLRSDAGLRDTTTVSFGPDGSSEITRVLGLGDVVVTETTEHDDSGNRTGGFTTVHKQGGLMYSGSIQPTPQPGGDQSSEPPTPGGGDGGSDDESTSPEPPSEDEQHRESGSSQGGEATEDEEDKGGNAPSMTSDGSYSVPALRLDDADLARMINWNRLGGAVTYPDPRGNDEGTVDERHAGKTTGPCGGLEQASFVPDAKFLKPAKGGWVTDPVPALRGSARSRGRGRKP